MAMQPMIVYKWLQTKCNWPKNFIVLGEIANQQDDITMCQYDLNYQPLLNYCEQQNIGWMAWVWDHDLCTYRQVSSTGDFVDLTTYGDDIVNNAVYGISTTTVRSEYLVNNGCLPVLSIATNFQSNSVSVFPNPGSGLFTIANLSDLNLLKEQQIYLEK